MLVATILAALGLLMVASIHRGQLGTPEYPQNLFLIRMEVALVMSMPLLVVANLVMVFRGLFTRNGRLLAASFFGIVAAIAATFFAMFIDAPTLVYAT